ncbi:hypothetical protein AXF42_Ash019965 [Apostasia shenzhenica]|uniref:DUF4228 domain-containing protein n=1 Tax=Apostasia shenzhenica TaxID=1088818 RepID=A0A2I0AZM3_9ASPA|nr:hypothetical protein AXF42_Ash019965 [Apostasia shenzhenica]
MGTCSSCEATAVAPMTTAKLILLDGELREFAWPVKAAHALHKNPDCFVCDSDEMEFGGYVSAVPADQELRPGQIYFALPRSMLRQPLQAEDLAALAVKASAALMKAAPGGARPLVFPEACPSQPMPAADRRRRRRSGGSGRSFESNLNAIPE